MEQQEENYEIGDEQEIDSEQDADGDFIREFQELGYSIDGSEIYPGGKVRENTLNRAVFRRHSASISPCFLACFRYLSPRYRRFAPTDRRKTARKVSKQLLALSRCE